MKNLYLFNGETLESLRNEKVVNNMLATENFRVSIGQIKFITPDTSSYSNDAGAAERAKYANITCGQLLGLDPLSVGGLFVAIDASWLPLLGFIKVKKLNQHDWDVYHIDLEQSTVEQVQELIPSFKKTHSTEEVGKIKFRRFTLPVGSTSKPGSTIGKLYSHVDESQLVDFLSGKPGYNKTSPVTISNNVTIGEFPGYTETAILVKKDGYYQFVEDQTAKIDSLSQELAEMKADNQEILSLKEDLEATTAEQAANIKTLRSIIDEFVDTSESDGDGDAVTRISLSDISELLLENQDLLNDNQASIKEALKGQLELIPSLIEELQKIGKESQTGSNQEVILTPRDDSKSATGIEKWMYGAGGLAVGLLLKK